MINIVEEKMDNSTKIMRRTTLERRTKTAAGQRVQTTVITLRVR